jgi:hypothetical protein
MKNNGFFSEFSAGTGISRTFLGGTTYRVSENGTVSVVKLAGYFYALVTIGEGMGYNFQIGKEIPMSVFGKMNLLTMFPYNNSFLIRPVMQLGVRYQVTHRHKPGSKTGT